MVTLRTRVIFFILFTAVAAPILLFTDPTDSFKLRIPFAKPELLEEDVTASTINAEENLVVEPPRMIKEPVRVFRDDERELILRIKEVEQALVEQVLADFSKDDVDLPKTAIEEKLKAMEQTLDKVKQIQYDCSNLVRKLRDMLHSAEREGQSVDYSFFIILFSPLAALVLTLIMIAVMDEKTSNKNNTKESTRCSTSRTGIYK